MRGSILGQSVNVIAQVKWASTKKQITKVAQLAAVASANQENRKFVLIHNLSNTVTIYVTSSSADVYSKGLPIRPGKERELSFGEAVDAYLMTISGKADAIIAEGY